MEPFTLDAFHRHVFLQPVRKWNSAMTSLEYNHYAAKDDEFVSNIASIESVKNCSILRYSKIENRKIEEYKDIERKKAKWPELAQKFGLFDVLAGMHALLLSIQDQHMGKLLSVNVH